MDSPSKRWPPPPESLKVLSANSSAIKFRPQSHHSWQSARPSACASARWPPHAAREQVDHRAIVIARLEHRGASASTARRASLAKSSWAGRSARGCAAHSQAALALVFPDERTERDGVYREVRPAVGHGFPVWPAFRTGVPCGRPRAPTSDAPTQTGKPWSGGRESSLWSWAGGPAIVDRS